MAIETPCTKVCVIEPVSGLCRGCGRDLNEIARWGSLTDDERHRVMADLPKRLDQLQRSRGVATEPARGS